jgi:hypothetical protein
LTFDYSGADYCADTTFKTNMQNAVAATYEAADPNTNTNAQATTVGCRRALSETAARRRLSTATRTFTVTQEYATQALADTGSAAVETFFTGTGNTFDARFAALDKSAFGAVANVNITAVTSAPSTPSSTTSTTSSAAKTVVSMVFAAVAFVGLAA